MSKKPGSGTIGYHVGKLLRTSHPEIFAELEALVLQQYKASPRGSSASRRVAADKQERILAVLRAGHNVEMTDIDGCEDDDPVVDIGCEDDDPV